MAHFIVKWNNFTYSVIIPNMEFQSLSLGQMFSVFSTQIEHVNSYSSMNVRISVVQLHFQTDRNIFAYFLLSRSVDLLQFLDWIFADSIKCVNTMSRPLEYGNQAFSAILKLNDPFHNSNVPEGNISPLLTKMTSSFDYRNTFRNKMLNMRLYN